MKTIKIISELRCWLEDIKLMYKQCGDSVGEAHFGSVLDRLTYLENMELEILDEDEFIDIEKLSTEDLYLTESQQRFIVHTINCLAKNQKKIIERLKDET